MKHTTYRILYDAHLGNLNREALLKARNEETDEFYHYIIDVTLGQKTMNVDWNINLFTKDFLSGSPREMLDETVFAFILRISSINKEEMYIRSFRKPESFVCTIAWEHILRTIIVCTLALLYNVSWNDKLIFEYLDPTVLRILNGEGPIALRDLMKNVGIKLARETPYQAELEYEKLNFLHVGQYSSFFWRYLHWMAEAYAKSDKKYYKKKYVELLLHSFFRTIRCGICMYHFRTLLEEFKTQLMDENTDFPKLWFDWHNRVHTVRREQYSLLKEPDYTESEYEKDRQFMLQALST